MSHWMGFKMCAKLASGVMLCGLALGCADDEDSGSGDGDGETQDDEGGSGTEGDGGGDTSDDSNLTCMADAEVTGTQAGLDPARKKQINGDNGSFTDECDSDGNLIEYVCETRNECSDPPNPHCETFETGNVESVNFDCDGRCEEGRCPARCPEHGDEVEVLEVGDSVVFKNLTDDRRYRCTLVFDQTDDTYDCASDPQVGDVFVISGLGLSSSWCTGGMLGNIATGDPQQCSWSCALE